MRELSFLYQMSLRFSEAASAHEFTLKCFPKTDEMQQIRQFQMKLIPDTRYFFSDDSFGNTTLCGNVEKRHSLFQITVSGEAVTGLAKGRTASLNSLGKYRYSSRYTKPGEMLLASYREMPIGKTVLEIAKEYMEDIYTSMQYQPGITTTRTTAEEAWSMKKGVCQDYAHILLALLRQHRIPARYVVGIMLGEGESHAWVEVEQDGVWYGIDPTNGKMVDDDYIFISNGRDAYDCQMNKGIMVGGGIQRQSVSVIVTNKSE